MANLFKFSKNKNTVITKSNNNIKTIVEKTTPKSIRHEFKVLSTKDVKNNRSKAYNFLTF